MKVMASQIIGGKLLNSRERVWGLVIDTDNGKILSVAVRPDYSKLVSFTDLEWVGRKKQFRFLYENIVFDREDLVRSNDLIRESKILKRQMIVCESGKKVGKLRDFEIDPNLGVLTQIQSGRYLLFFGRKAMVARKQIIKISRDLIRIEDDERFVTVEQKKAELNAPPV